MLNPRSITQHKTKISILKIKYTCKMKVFGKLFKIVNQKPRLIRFIKYKNDNKSRDTAALMSDLGKVEHKQKSGENLA